MAALREPGVNSREMRDAQTRWSEESVEREKSAAQCAVPVTRRDLQAETTNK